MPDKLKFKPNDLNRYEEGESLCEDALEVLQEILHYDPSLRVWLDKNISLEIGANSSADVVWPPRLVMP